MWPFKKRSAPQPKILAFKSPEAAFEYACAFLSCPWQARSVLPAVAVKVGKAGNGLQTFALKVASDSGGREIPYCMSLNPGVPVIAEGDFVAFLIAEHDPALPGLLGTIGFVVAKLEPTFDLQEGGWKTAT